jgi:hypothetical protein
VVHDLLNDRTGLKTYTGGSTSNYAKLEVWASNRNPAEVVATGKHNRRIVRSDGVITVDTCCTLRSTETAFHVTIDLYITVNDLPHHQKRWMRTFPRVLL